MNGVLFVKAAMPVSKLLYCVLLTGPVIFPGLITAAINPSNCRHTPFDASNRCLSLSS